MLRLLHSWMLLLPPQLKQWRVRVPLPALLPAPLPAPLRVPFPSFASFLLPLLPSLREQSRVALLQPHPQFVSAQRELPQFPSSEHFLPCELRVLLLPALLPLPHAACPSRLSRDASSQQSDLRKLTA